VRKLILTLSVLGLAVGPAALAIGEPLTAPADAPKLVAITALDRAALRLEASRKERVAERHAERRQARKQRKRQRPARVAAASAPKVAVPPQLQTIAQCESGGNPRAVGGGGQFRGKYQFTYATWAAVGGSGDPAAAPEVEQDRRAAMLYAQSGPGQWPVCGA
jgi:hypothetical protein